MKEELKKLLQHSYSPYSNFAVAAIVVMKDGQTFSGVNVENASYGATICAERSAIVSAISQGYKRYDFEKLYIMVDSEHVSTPCFLCRQHLIEFFELEKEVICYSKTFEEKKFFIRDLCPSPFTEEDLK